MSLLKGKIAGIINEKNIIINKGEKYGVTIGMKFAVKLIIPDVTDPDNPDNVVSGLYFTKGSVQVTQLYPNMSFCDILPSYSGFQFGFPTVNYPLVTAPLITPEKWAISRGDEIEQIVE